MRRLDAPAPPVDVLSEDERRRAAAYVVPSAQARFIAARCLLRAILGDVLDLRPDRVPLARQEGGKPVLAGLPAHFSLSHSGDSVIVAVSPDGPVGVDIEALRLLPDAAAVARRFLDAATARRVAAAPPDTRAAQFLRLWTWREAVAKALGAPLMEILALPEPVAEAEAVVQALDLGPRWMGHVACAVPAGPLAVRLHP